MKIVAVLLFLLGLAKGVGLIVLVSKGDYSGGEDWFIKQSVYAVSLLAVGVTLWFGRARKQSR